VEKPQSGGAGCGYTSVIEGLVSSASALLRAFSKKRSYFWGHFLTSFQRADSFISERRLPVKTEVSIEYCVV
jgi:hypothetical protein